MQETERQNMGDYLASKNREEFVAICVAKGMKRDTAKRRYYKLRKISTKAPEQITIKKDIENSKYKFENEDVGLIVIPDNLKLIQLTDMIRYNKKITEAYLTKNGFSVSDIAWIKFVRII